MGSEFLHPLICFPIACNNKGCTGSKLRTRNSIWVSHTEEADTQVLGPSSDASLLQYQGSWVRSRVSRIQTGSPIYVCVCVWGAGGEGRVILVS